MSRIIIIVVDINLMLPSFQAYNFGPYASTLKTQTVFSAQDK